MENNFRNKGKLALLLVWFIFAFIALVFNINQYLNNREKDIYDLPVSTAVTCRGGCLYYGVKDYAVGTACRGIRPGDPDGSGGKWAGKDFSSNCYVCGSNGNFKDMGTDISACSHCYAKCLGDPTPTQYEDGDRCANGTGSNYGIYTCKKGAWVKEAQDKCAGACPGDGEYTLYDKGDTCFSDGKCYQCVEPGRENQGGFDLVDNKVCEADGVISNKKSCRLKCIGYSTEREFYHQNECNAGTGVHYGTYACNDGEWKKASKPKCVLKNSVGKYRPGDLANKGETFKYLGKCYQCTAPNEEINGGFLQVEDSLCEKVKTIPSHARKGACLGDFDGNGRVNVNDFAAFAKLFGKDLDNTNWHYDIVFSGSHSLNVNDFAAFALNFNKNTSSCNKRDVDLQPFSN